MGILERLQKRYREHTKFPWRADNHLGCKTIKGNKGGPHQQAQYLTEVAYTPGLWNDIEDAANARMISDLEHFVYFAETGIPILEKTVRSCSLCYEGLIYGDKPEDGPESECPNCWNARELLAYVRYNWLRN